MGAPVTLNSHLASSSIVAAELLGLAMRQLMFFAVALVVVGAVVARYADKAVTQPTPQAAIVQPTYEPTRAEHVRPQPDA